MNRLVFIAILLMRFAISAEAQQIKQGSFDALHDCSAATLQYDFSQAMVGEGTLGDYIQLMMHKEGDDYATNFYKDIREIVVDFIEEYNDTNSPLVLTISEAPPVSLMISVKRISRNGNELTADYIFSDKSTQNIIVAIEMTAKNGRCGSFTNLMGDAFETAAKRLGKYIKKNLKSIKKQ